MIKVKNGIATREPLPSFLIGLAAESLCDLSWTDPALGVSDCAWWPEEDQSPALAQYERYGDEVLTVDNARMVVVSSRSVEPWMAVEIAAELAPLVAASIAKTYLDVDGVHDDAVGSRTTEYQKAEDAARAYAEADYTGDVSGYVSGYAASNPTGEVQTNQWAADGIIARADAFHVAELNMRNTRFAKQADMRAAATAAELNAATAAWDAYIAGIRTQLDL